MIQANELRIGNLVYNFLKQPITVSWENIKWSQDIEPIPLTPEILGKAGFENIGSDHLGGWTKYIKKSNVVCSDVVVSFGEAGKNLYVTHSNNGVAYCLYIHQLQNLYFALTGEELEITL